MKKLIIAAATFVTISTAALAGQNNEYQDRDSDFRMSLFEMTAQMVDDEIKTSEIHMKRLTAFQRLLKQMMENELSSGHGSK